MVSDPPIEAVYAQVQQIYALYRTTLLNRLYYAERLTWTRKWQLALDWGAAIATSGAIGSWAIWKTEQGQIAWAVLGAMAAIIGLIRPALHLPQNTERYTRLWVEYGRVYYSLQALAGEIAVARAVTPAMWAAYLALRGQADELVPLDDPKPNRQDIDRLSEQVNERLPRETLWYPRRTAA